MYYEELQSRVAQLAEEFIEGMFEVTAEDLGLDPRAGHRLLVGQGCIAAPVARRGALDYYGGFEYVDSDSIMVIGSWVIYSGSDSRVARAIDRAPVAAQEEGDDE